MDGSNGFPAVVVAGLMQHGADALAVPFQRTGVPCVTATSRRELLQVCSRFSPELVIVSFAMVQLGLTAPQIIEAGGHHAAVALDRLSSLHSLQAYRAGFEDCLALPLEPADIKRLRDVARARIFAARRPSAADLP